jgi:hypothetical protein
VRLVLNTLLLSQEKLTAGGIRVGGIRARIAASESAGIGRRTATETRDSANAGARNDSFMSYQNSIQRETTKREPMAEPELLFWQAVVQSLMGLVWAIRRFKLGETRKKCEVCGK